MGIKKLCDDSTAKIQWWSNWSVNNFDIMEIRHSLSMKFDGGGVNIGIIYFICQLITSTLFQQCYATG